MAVDDGIAGRTALVTGAGGGIGSAVADALAAAGARIAAVDLDAAAAERLPGALAYPVDVREPAAVDSVVARVERDLGPVDVCVNVAGILRTAPVVDTGDDDWAEVFAVNTTGVFNVSRAVARAMVPRRRGAIVTVASNAAGVPRIGMAAYAASKAAAVMFTRCLGLELAGYGIRCNVVAPGSTNTRMQALLAADTDVVAGAPEVFRVGIPLGRIADPTDVAEAVVFLASHRARHITMHALYVDGGATLRG